MKILTEVFSSTGGGDPGDSPHAVHAHPFPWPDLGLTIQCMVQVMDYAPEVKKVQGRRGC